MSQTAERPTISSHPAQWVVSIAEYRDRASFIALFTHFAPKVKGYLMRHGVSEPMAEELTQETFLSVWRKADQFDPMRASAVAWIYTIARNLWVDVVRHERHPDDNRIAEPPVAQLTPEEHLKTLEGEKRLRDAMGALPQEQAEVLRLSFFEEKTHAEIADHLGLPLGTVKSRIRLAAAHLRSTLDGFV